MIHVKLWHVNLSVVVSKGLEANARIKIIVLDGDFAIKDEGNYEQSNFEPHQVKECEGNVVVLERKTLSLFEGRGELSWELPIR